MTASKKSSRSISENPSKDAQDALKATKKKNNPPKRVEFAEPTSKAHFKKKSESKPILSGFEEGDTDGDSSEEEDEEADDGEDEEDADDGEDEEHEDEDKEDEEEDDGDDSSDEGSDQPADDNLQPQPGSKDSRAPNRKSKRKAADEETGVIYVGRIPHGFYEDEMKSYFSQFGEVLRVRLSRCKRTGKPKHYGFIEFKHLQVAQIVAETIHNYLLSGKLLQCKLFEKHEIHPKLWVGAGQKFMKDCKIRLDRQKRNQPKTLPKQAVITNRLVEREKRKRQKLAEQGIDYDFSGYIPLAQPQAAPKSTSDENPKKSKKSKKKA